MSRGRLEAIITIPVGGLDLAVNGTGVTMPSGTYYWDTFLTTFTDRINNVVATAAATLSRGENGTGRVTIAATPTFTITWIDLDLRELLGYTENLAGSASYLAPQHARALWIGTCPYNAPNAIFPWVGWPEADFRSVESAAGLVWAFSGQKKLIASLEWESIRRSRASKADESIVGESFQRFVEDGVWGLSSWGTPGGPVRFFPDADAGDWVSYYVTDIKQFRPEQFADGWAGGPWMCKLPRLVFAASSTVTEPGPGEPPPPAEECAAVFVGSGPPPVDLVAQDGDMYLDTLTGDLYQLTAT